MDLESYYTNDEGGREMIGAKKEFIQQKTKTLTAIYEIVMDTLREETFPDDNRTAALLFTRIIYEQMQDES